MTKAAHALTPAVMLALAALGGPDVAAAETMLPCNALCRAWMGMDQPAPPPPAVVELHPAPQVSADEPAPLPAPPHPEATRRSVAREASAVPMPPHRPTRAASDREPSRASRLQSAGATPPAGSSHVIRVAFAPAAVTTLAPRPRAIASAAPREPRATRVLIPAPAPAMAPVFGVLIRPGDSALRPSTPVATPDSAATPRPSVQAAPVLAEQPAAVVDAPARGISAAAPLAPANPVARQPVVEARPEPAVPLAPQAAATSPTETETSMVVATLVPTAAPDLGGSALRPAEAPPIPFPPALDVIATLMLTAPARH